MFTSINRTVFDIPLTWDRTRFEASRVKCRQARKLVETSVNAQFNKQLKDVFYRKLDIEKDITDAQQRLLHQDRKVRLLDNLTEVAAQSLTDYFDKRMENVRSAIQEHCTAIEKILREENEHWNEIHTAIDQNLITSEDLHPPKNVEAETLPANIHTIDEAEEEEEEEEEGHPSKLSTNETVTSLLTQMIRKSRLLSNRSSIRGDVIPSKEERFSVIIPLTSARRTLPVVDTTFVVKLEETKTTEANQSNPVEVAPIESLPTLEAEATSSYSQPKPPARLYFSPTLLQDDDEPELIPPVLSTIDQNRSNMEKSKAMPRRFGQTFLLDDVKNEELNESEDTENLRPKISVEMPFMIQCDPTILPENDVSNESHHSETPEHQKSMIYSKRRTQAAATTKIEPERSRVTRRATRNQKAPKEIETTKRQTRKRKQSTSVDGGNTTVALRKKKAIAPLSPSSPKINTRKKRGRKAKEIPIREPSPLPIIDRSKHYSTRFSTRSHRFNNLTLSAITTTMLDHDDQNDQSNRSRAKSTRRTRHHDKEEKDEMLGKTRSKQTKTRSKQRATSTMVTRNRRK